MAPVARFGLDPGGEGERIAVVELGRVLAGVAELLCRRSERPVRAPALAGRRVHVLARFDCSSESGFAFGDGPIARRASRDLRSHFG